MLINSFEIRQNVLNLSTSRKAQGDRPPQKYALGDNTKLTRTNYDNLKVQISLLKQKKGWKIYKYQNKNVKTENVVTQLFEIRTELPMSCEL